MDPELLRSPELRSGKVYLPWEALMIVGILEPLVKPLMPRDSHAWMNLDSPKQGYRFEYAVQAAIQRTRIEFENTMKGMREELVRMFEGR